MNGVLELLQQAAQAMPERFRDAPLPWVDYTYPHSWQVLLRGEWEAIWIEGAEDEWNPIWDLALEAACREECEARGWRWWSYRASDHYAACVYVGGDEGPDHQATTPAEALLIALLAALRGRQ